MKSRFVTVAMMVGLLATAMPITAMARADADDRPGWAYQHPGWWQYYKNHSRVNHNRPLRDNDRWDRFGGRENRDRDGDRDAARDRNGWSGGNAHAYWNDRGHQGGWFGRGDHDRGRGGDRD